MKDKSNFGIFLQRLRKKKKLSQKELANELDIAHTRISNLETSIIYPNDTILKKYSDFFDIPLEELQELAIADREAFRIQDLGNRINKYKNEILSIYDQSENQERLADIIKNIINSEQNLGTVVNKLNSGRELLVPYFPTLLAFRKANRLGAKKEIKKIYVNLDSKLYSNPNNIIVVNTSTSIKSMNRFIPEYSDVFIELDTDIQDQDIVFYQNKSSYGLARFIYHEEYKVSILHFDSLEISLLDDIILTEENEDNYKILGKVIAVHISNKFLNL